VHLTKFPLSTFPYASTPPILLVVGRPALTHASPVLGLGDPNLHRASSSDIDLEDEEEEGEDDDEEEGERDPTPTTPPPPPPPCN